MPTVLRWKALVRVAVWMTLAGFGGRQAVAAPRPPAAANPPSDGLVAPGLLEHARLRPLWQQRLPVKDGEDLAAMTVLGDRLYIRSSQDYLWSLDRAGGNIVFSRSVAPPGIPVLGLALYGNRLITVIGNQLVELDRDSGKEQRVSDLELSIIAPVVRNSQFFFVSAADRRLHALRAKDLVQMFQVAAEDDSLITSVVADDNIVVFGTDTGRLVAIMPDAPRKLWEFKAPEAVSGQVMQDYNSFYFASIDTNVYRVDAVEVTKSALMWRYQTEAVLARAPLLTAGFVYQYAPGRGLTAIRKETGRAAWSLPEGVDLLAEAGNRAYVVSKFPTLVVMDNATGHKLYAVNFAPVAHYAVNTADARLYIADETGCVVCLEPTM
jgi:hypothetical protein